MKTNAVVVSTIGIDTGKNTLHLIGLDRQGTIVLREKLARGRIGTRFANVPRCLIGIEAGMATHYVARELVTLGHDVKQVPLHPPPWRNSIVTYSPVLKTALPWRVGERIAMLSPRR